MSVKALNAPLTPTLSRKGRGRVGCLALSRKGTRSAIASLVSSDTVRLDYGTDAKEWWAVLGSNQ